MYNYIHTFFNIIKLKYNVFEITGLPNAATLFNKATCGVSPRKQPEEGDR